MKAFKTFLFLFMAISIVACSDDKDDTTPPDPPKDVIDEVIEELESMPEVKAFTDALKKVSESIDVTKDKLTVLAPKNFTTTRATDEEQILLRHIVEGTHDLSKLTNDTLMLKSITDEVLYVIKTEEGKYLVNGIPLVSITPTEAGESYIYVVEETIPEAPVPAEPKYKYLFRVLDINQDWSPENNHETTPSASAIIKFYTLEENGIYTELDSIAIDKEGYGVFGTDEEDIYYQVVQEDKKTTYNGYLPTGVFTSQEEIDNLSVMYKTDSMFDILMPGSVKLADLNGDGIINAEDKFIAEYFEAEASEEPEEVTIYLVSSNAFSNEENFITLEDMIKIKDSHKETLETILGLSRQMDNSLTLPNINYPSLSNFRESEKLWEEAYKYIRSFLMTVDKISVPGYPQYTLDEWEKGQPWAEFAYVYSLLVNWWGDVVLFTDYEDYGTDIAWAIPRNSKAEVMEFIEELAQTVPSESSNALKAILARYYTNEKEYEKAFHYAKGIIDSGQYALVENPFNTENNDEVILGGYQTTSKKNFAHPLRYREVVLTYAETACELGNIPEALISIDQLYSLKGMPSYAGDMSAEAIRNVIRELWNSEFADEGLDYMLINRWGKLQEVLGNHGAQPYNNVLPIPQRELDLNPALTQNPGY